MERLGKLLTNNDEVVSSLEHFYDFVFNVKEPTLFVLSDEIDFIDANELGFSENILKKLGERIKEKDHRIISLFSKKYGLASEVTYQRVAINKILDHATFYDLMRLDYDSLIFTCYGKDYACDFYKFKGGYSNLPDYAKRRIAIYSTSNFASMVVADHLKIPWIYQLEERFSDDQYENFLNCYKMFPLRPNSKPIIHAFDLSMKKTFDESININNVEMDFIIPTLEIKKKPKKVKKTRIKLRGKDGGKIRTTELSEETDE